MKDLEIRIVGTLGTLLLIVGVATDPAILRAGLFVAAVIGMSAIAILWAERGLRG